jgi:hypothetical protein
MDTNSKPVINNSSRPTDDGQFDQSGPRANVEASESPNELSAETRKKVVFWTVPIAVVTMLAIFFGILFWPFGIVFGMIALIMISMQVLNAEASE